jgi:hypothetical protein
VLAEGEFRLFEKILKNFKVFESAGLGLVAGRKAIEAAGKKIERPMSDAGISENGLRRRWFSIERENGALRRTLPGSRGNPVRDAPSMAGAS